MIIDVDDVHSVDISRSYDVHSVDIYRLYKNIDADKTNRRQ